MNQISSFNYKNGVTYLVRFIKFYRSSPNMLDDLLLLCPSFLCYVSFTSTTYNYHKQPFLPQPTRIICIEYAKWVCSTREGTQYSRRVPSLHWEHIAYIRGCSIDKSNIMSTPGLRS